MALWSKKKVSNKITKILEEKQISFVVDDEQSISIKFELCFLDSGFMLYPYITITEEIGLISFNVNLVESNLKSCYNILNDINKKALFLKAFIQEDIIVLEYRFQALDDINVVIDSLLNDLFSLENIIQNM